ESAMEHRRKGSDGFTLHPIHLPRNRGESGSGEEHATGGAPCPVADAQEGSVWSTSARSPATSRAVTFWKPRGSRPPRWARAPTKPSRSARLIWKKRLPACTLRVAPSGSTTGETSLSCPCRLLGMLSSLTPL